MKSDVSLTPEMLQANPGIAVLLALFSLLIVTLLAGCLSTWIWALTCLFMRKPMLSIEPWRPRTWGFLDLVLAGFFVIASQVVGFKLWADSQGLKMKDLKEADTGSLSAMAVGAATLLAAMAITIAWLMVRYSSTLNHIGFSFHRWWKQLALGLGAAAMWLPIVILIMAAVSLGLGKEYDHPLIKRLNEDGTVGSYLLAVFCAVIAAPLVEEFLFRVLLQGWLQSIPWSMNSLWWLLGASRSQAQQFLTGNVDGGLPAEVAPVNSAPVQDGYANPYQPGPASLQPPILSPISPALPAPEAIPVAADVNPPIWPVFVAGTLFGLAHWDYGASFVPLIVLGIVLGFLYRATHSIWPCFILHFSLNAFSMAGLGLGLLIESIT